MMWGWSCSRSRSEATYGALPKAGLVETLKEGQRFTTVGYGANGYERIESATAPAATACLSWATATVQP